MPGVIELLWESTSSKQATVEELIQAQANAGCQRIKHVENPHCNRGQTLEKDEDQRD